MTYHVLTYNFYSWYTGFNVVCMHTTTILTSTYYTHSSLECKHSLNHQPTGISHIKAYVDFHFNAHHLFDEFIWKGWQWRVCNLQFIFFKGSKYNDPPKWQVPFINTSFQISLKTKALYSCQIHHVPIISYDVHETNSTSLTEQKAAICITDKVSVMFWAYIRIK